MAATIKANNEKPNTYLGNSLMNNTTLQTEIQNVSTFQFGESSIRVVSISNEPWFVAKDLCNAINISNYRDAIERLDEDEKGVALTDTLGGQQEMNIVSESGMYTLILRCRDAVKKGSVPHRFRKWVTAEVLPQIRKTGQYSLSQSVVKIEKLSKEHQTFIKNLVMDRTKMLPKEHQAKAAITQWSALKTHFGKSYKNINDDQFVEAVSLLARLPLEGELIINEPSKSEDYYLTESEFCKVAWAVFSAKQQNQLLEKLIEPLNAIQSRLTSDVWDYAREYKSTWQNGMEIMSRLAENLEVDRHSPLNLQRIKQHLADNQRLI